MFSKEILGVRVDFGMSMDDVLIYIENVLLKKEGTHYICTTNPEFIMEAQKDEEFKRIINQSDLSVPDGIGVVYAKDYLEKIKSFKRNVFFPLKAFFAGLCIGVKEGQSKERITGVDLTHQLCNLASRKKYNVFFLGGRAKNALGKHVIQNDKDMATEVSHILSSKYPGLNVIGATSKFSAMEKDDKATVEYIKKCMDEKNVSSIDFLFICYGHPRQEKWIARNTHLIPAHVSLGTGGTFDNIVGSIELPPTIYTSRNMGWLYRLIRQPWRIKRIFMAFPTFPLKVFRQSLK